MMAQYYGGSPHYPHVHANSCGNWCHQRLHAQPGCWETHLPTLVPLDAHADSFRLATIRPVLPNFLGALVPLRR
jgi:hypothetical protein